MLCSTAIDSGDGIPHAGAQNIHPPGNHPQARFSFASFPSLLHTSSSHHTMSSDPVRKDLWLFGTPIAHSYVTLSPEPAPPSARAR